MRFGYSSLHFKSMLLLIGILVIIWLFVNGSQVIIHQESKNDLFWLDRFEVLVLSINKLINSVL